MTNLDKILDEIEERAWPFDDFPEDQSTWASQMKEVDNLVKALRCAVKFIETGKRIECDCQKLIEGVQDGKVCVWHHLEESLEQIMAGDNER